MLYSAYELNEILALDGAFLVFKKSKQYKKQSIFMHLFEIIPIGVMRPKLHLAAGCSTSRRVWMLSREKAGNTCFFLSSRSTSNNSSCEVLANRICVHISMISFTEVMLSTYHCRTCFSDNNLRTMVTSPRVKEP